MRLPDIRSLADGATPGQCHYWVGSRQALSRGDYDRLRPVYVLARGRFTEYCGECGTAVAESPTAPTRLAVATWRRLSWDRYTHKRDDWAVEAINAAAILLTDAEYRERVRLREEDQRRHAAARKAVNEERRQLGIQVAAELGLNGLSPLTRVTPQTRYDRERHEDVPTGGLHLTIDLTPAQAKRLLKARGRKLLHQLANLRDPAC